MGRSAIIVGAGIAGLSTGCYARVNGYKVVGQWTMPFAGVTMSALSGRQPIQLLCKESGRPFLTSAA
jgi:succinate dehydrogenase/fumarate reductase flavoprotein subunit